MMDIEQTLEERGRRYGRFTDHARIAQDLQEVMRNSGSSVNWTRLAPDQAQALTVIADKIARILNGDPDYIDNWHDIAGYAKLVEERIEKETAKAVAKTLLNEGRPNLEASAVAKQANQALLSGAKVAPYGTGPLITGTVVHDPNVPTTQTLGTGPLGTAVR